MLAWRKIIENNILTSFLHCETNILCRFSCPVFRVSAPLNYRSCRQAAPAASADAPLLSDALRRLCSGCLPADALMLSSGATLSGGAHGTSPGSSAAGAVDGTCARLPHAIGSVGLASASGVWCDIQCYTVCRAEEIHTGGVGYRGGWGYPGGRGCACVCV